MIKEIRIQPRSSGKTTWAREKAESLQGFYMSGTDFTTHSKLRTLPKVRTLKSIVIDEPFHSSGLLYFIISNQHNFDFYLIGTPLVPLDSIYPDFYYMLQTQFPEVLI